MYVHVDVFEGSDASGKSTDFLKSFKEKPAASPGGVM